MERNEMLRELLDAIQESEGNISRPPRGPPNTHWEPRSRSPRICPDKNAQFLKNLSGPARRFPGRSTNLSGQGHLGSHKFEFSLFSGLEARVF